MKLALKILGVLVLLAIATPFGFAMWLQSYVTPEYLVKVTEQSCNCRAQLDSSSLTLFSWPPALRLNGIKIAPRDEHVGKPLAERPPLADAPVQIDLAYAELLSNDILDGRITPNLLRFAGVEVRETLDPQTGSSLEKLFQPPPLAVAAAGTIEVPKAMPVAEATQTPLPPDAPAGTPRTYGSPAPAATQPEPPTKAERIPLREIRLEKAHIHVTNKAVAAQIEADISDLDLILSDIDVDPDDIARHNHIHASLKARIRVEGMAEIGGAMKPVQFVNASIHGDGNVTPIEPKEMLWKPAAALSLTFDKGSTLGGHMTLGDAAGDQMSKLLEHGLDFRNVRLGGTLIEDANVNVNYDRVAIFFKAPARISLPDFEFTVSQEAWINTKYDNQYMPVHLVFGPAIREPLVQGIAAKGLGDGLTRSILSLISDERGNPCIDLIISGSLSRPVVQHKLMKKLESFGGSAVQELLSNPEEAKGLLNGLKSLFKKN